MTGTPQIIVTLQANGQLSVELPSRTATRHKVVLKDGEAESTIRQILHHQMLGETEIGLDGAPTQAQVTHWERHQIWPGMGCRFCIGEGRIAVGPKEQKKNVVMKRSDGVEVRRIAQKVSGLPKKVKAKKVVIVATSKKSAEALGL